MVDTDSRAIDLRPFRGRVMVIPSEATEQERHSGLIVPGEFDGDDGVKRGIVTHIDPWRSEPIPSAADIGPGAVVYYRGGTKVLDTVVLNREEILAYEFIPDDDQHP